MTTATVISDASFYREVGKKKPGFGGWAAWIRVDGISDPIKGFGSINAPKGVELTSTICEMYAAINGAWLAHQRGATSILIQSDCMTVIELIAGKQIKPQLRNIWFDGIKMANLEDVIISGRHVQGHNVVDVRSWVNDWCDQHARIGMTLARKGKRCLSIV